MMLLEVDADVWLKVFGRFHIVLLHLPIGLIPAMLVLEFGAAVFRRPLPRGALITLAVMTALSAGAALASGLVLADEKVDSDTLVLHKNFAIAMSACCVLLPLLAALRTRRAFRLALVVAMALSVIAGHFGGTLTHRAGFLFAPLERATQQATDEQRTEEQRAEEQRGEADPKPVEQTKPPEVATEPEGAVTYTAHIAPLFERTCTTCHNADDYEGDLDLTSYKLVVGAGYEDDPYVVKSEPDKSYLLEVCELPKDDEMHMPPEDEEQLTKPEIQLLRRWIAAGCPE